MYGMADRMREIILSAAEAAGVGKELQTPEGNTVVLDEPWEWRECYPAVSEAVGQEVIPDTSAEDLLAIAKKHHLDVDENLDVQQLGMGRFDELVEANIIQPTFIYR